MYARPSRTSHDSGSEEAPELSEGDRAFQRLFSAPPVRSSSGSLQSTLSQAKQCGKWVLVNIQDPELFASHMLNRDVWKDETVEEMLGGSFIFWQRDRKSQEGSGFVQLYSVNNFPHIAILDPRTGRAVKSWPANKFQDAFMALEALTGFLDDKSAPVKGKLEPSSPLKASKTPPSRESADSSVTFVSATSQKITAASALPPLPTFPPSGTPGTVRVAVRLSSGTREQLTVHPSEKLRVILDFCWNREGVQVDVKLPGHPPQSLRDDFDPEIVTVQEAGLAGALLTVSRL